MSGRLSVDFVRSWLLHISTRINISILTDFLIKLMQLPVSFFDSKKTGDILDKGKEAAADVYDQAAAVVDDAYEAASGRIRDETSA